MPTVVAYLPEYKPGAASSHPTTFWRESAWETGHTEGSRAGLNSS